MPIRVLQAMLIIAVTGKSPGAYPVTLADGTQGEFAEDIRSP